MLYSQAPQVEPFYKGDAFEEVDDFYYEDYVGSFLTLDQEWIKELPLVPHSAHHPKLFHEHPPSCLNDKFSL
jgi:hypothetical protein